MVRIILQLGVLVKIHPLDNIPSYFQMKLLNLKLTKETLRDSLNHVWTDSPLPKPQPPLGAFGTKTKYFFRV